MRKPIILLEDALASLLILWEEQKLDMVVQTFRHLIDQATRQMDFQDMLKQVFQKLPDEMWLQHPDCAWFRARVMCGANDAESMRAFLQAFDRIPDRLRVFQGWLLVSEGKHHEALDLLQGVTSWFFPWEEGFGLRLMGECAASLGHPVAEWDALFGSAARILSGRGRGQVLKVQAWHHWNQGNLGKARSLWTQALSDLKKDPYETAWVHQSLGMALLRTHPLEAERQFQEMWQWSRKREGQAFQSRAMSGIATVRRTLGEFARAAHAYQEAIALQKKGKGDLEDLEQALWGLGLTLRLMGRYENALESFQAAMEVRDGLWLNVEVAAIWALMGNPEGARNTLTQARPRLTRERNLFWAVQAEAQRLEGRDPRDCLQHIDFSHQALADEALCFPALFRQAEQMGFPVVLPLQPVKSKVEVFAEGPLKVLVNGRPAPLDARGIPGLMLVFLLESGKRATTEMLAELVFEGPEQGKKVRQTVWGHIEKLRDALGWKDSVAFHEGTYQLDLHAFWEYDIHQKLTLGQPIRAFLSGQYMQWVHEKQQQYQAID